MSSKQPIIGVLTHRRNRFIAGKKYLSALAVEAKKHGCHLIVYSPPDIDEKKGVVSGFMYNSAAMEWKPLTTHLPDVVYDRFSYMERAAFRRYVAYRKKSRLRYLNNRFAHKWNAHKILSQSPALQPYLPETTLMQQGALASMLDKYTTVYAKPVNGSGGKKILRMERINNTIRLRGRDSRGNVVRQTYDCIEQAEKAAAEWCRDGRYILQQGLTLTLLPGMICDTRVLIQKNGDGQWQITGMIGKKSPLSRVTSNLSGGGKAVSLKKLLARFSAEKQQKLMKEMKRVSFILANFIERRFGQFIEFGLDFGIDTAGNAWLIEVNTKPNRELFRVAGDIRTYRESISCPVRYAIHTLRKAKASCGKEGCD